MLEVDSWDLGEERRMVVVLECLVQLTFSVCMPGIMLGAQGTAISKMGLFFVLSGERCNNHRNILECHA